MKRYMTGILLVALLGVHSLFGFGGGFTSFPGLGGAFPGFNPGGIGSGGEQQEEKPTEFAVLAGYSTSLHEGEASYSGGNSHYSGNEWEVALAPSVQLRLTVNRLQFMVDGTWNSFFIGDEDTAAKVFMVYGGAGYQLVNHQRFSLSASIVAGFRSNWWSENSGSSANSYDSYYSSYSDRNQLKYNGEGFLVGADLLAMLKLGKHLGIYANGLLSTGGLGAKLGVAYRF